MATIEEIEARRTARKQAGEVARLAQLAIDLEALDALEVAHGDGRVARLDLPAFIPGLPTLIVVRAPTGAESKRFSDMVRVGDAKLVKSGPAADMLGATCVVYPDAPTFAKVLDAFGSLKNDTFMAAHKLSSAVATEEGKG